MSTAEKLHDFSDNKHRSLSLAVQQAIASLHLEGITLSKDSLYDLELFSQGKLSKADAIKRVLLRVKSA